MKQRILIALHVNLMQLSATLNQSEPWGSFSATERCYWKVTPAVRDGFQDRGILGQLSFWGLTQVWRIWLFVWKSWKYAPLMCSAPSKIYLLLCRLWFYNFLRSAMSNPNGLL